MTLQFRRNIFKKIHTPYQSEIDKKTNAKKKKEDAWTLSKVK